MAGLSTAQVRVCVCVCLCVFVCVCTSWDVVSSNLNLRSCPVSPWRLFHLPPPPPHDLLCLCVGYETVRLWCASGVTDLGVLSEEVGAVKCAAPDATVVVEGLVLAVGDGATEVDTDALLALTAGEPFVVHHRSEGNPLF